MIRRTVEHEFASSTTGLHGRTVVGTLLGDKKSANEVRKYIFHPSKRKYRRVKTVFECENCYGSAASQITHFFTRVKEIIVLALKLLLLFFVIWIFFGDHDNQENSSRSEPVARQANETPVPSDSSVPGGALEQQGVPTERELPLLTDDALPTPVSASSESPADDASEFGQPIDPNLSNVTKPEPARIVRMPSASRYYPKDAKQKGEEGSVVVQTCVDEKGKILGAPTIVSSSSYDSLDIGAIELAKAGKYRPAQSEGRPLAESCVSFRVIFKFNS